MSVKALVPKLLNPLLPGELKPFFATTKRLLVPEINFTGQLATLVRAAYRTSVIRMNHVKGVPFFAEEILEKILQLAATPNGNRTSPDSGLPEQIGAPRGLRAFQQIL